jgi:transposase-like protein
LPEPHHRYASGAALHPEFEKKWKRYARNIGLSWRVDETYMKVRGEWTYLYRVVDGEGCTVDFWLSKRRDVNAAKCFMRRALREHGDPLSITLDAYAASRRAVAQLKEEGEIHYEMRMRSCQYLNNIVEQDHRRIKQRVYPMLRLKVFENARVVISGIELAQRIRKGQFDLRQLGEPRQATPSSGPVCWRHERLKSGEKHQIRFRWI